MGRGTLPFPRRYAAHLTSLRIIVGGFVAFHRILGQLFGQDSHEDAQGVWVAGIVDGAKDVHEGLSELGEGPLHDAIRGGASLLHPDAHDVPALLGRLGDAAFRQQLRRWCRARHDTKVHQDHDERAHWSLDAQGRHEDLVDRRGLLVRATATALVLVVVTIALTTSSTTIAAVKWRQAGAHLQT